MVKSGSARNSSFDSGVASEFLVLSILFRMGLDAFFSLGNKKSIDLIIKAKNGIAISVDVKSVRGYSSIVVNNVKSLANHFIVVVVYNSKFSDPSFLPEFYIIPSEDIKKLAKNFKGQRRLFKGNIVNYKDVWDPLRT